MTHVLTSFSLLLMEYWKTTIWWEMYKYLPLFICFSASTTLTSSAATRMKLLRMRTMWWR